VWGDIKTASKAKLDFLGTSEIHEKVILTNYPTKIEAWDLQNGKY
jgi:hypothetical protein